MSAGERVLDVQPKLGARVRLLAAGDTNNYYPNDARSVATAALRLQRTRRLPELRGQSAGRGPGRLRLVRAGRGSRSGSGIRPGVGR